MWSKYKRRKVIHSTDVLFFCNLIKHLHLIYPNPVIQNKLLGTTCFRKVYSFEDDISIIDIENTTISIQLK